MRRFSVCPSRGWVGQGGGVGTDCVGFAVAESEIKPRNSLPQPDCGWVLGGKLVLEYLWLHHIFIRARTQTLRPAHFCDK